MSVLHLWLRAGSDGVRLGGDPLSHHLFMLLLLKGQHNPDLRFEVHTVNEAKPPLEFRELGLRKAPAIEIDGETYSHEDDIIEFLDQWSPQRRRTEADDVTADLFRHFAFFIKDVNKDPKGLLGELHRIDEFLGGAADFAYLCGGEPSFLDTLILPRLHSIRIAAQALKEFSIPEDMRHLWSYIEHGYQLETFRNSCPSDQEIILYWAERPDTPMISSQRRAALYRQKSSHTFDVPRLNS